MMVICCQIDKKIKKDKVFHHHHLCKPCFINYKLLFIFLFVHCWFQSQLEIDGEKVETNRNLTKEK